VKPQRPLRTDEGEAGLPLYGLAVLTFKCAELIDPVPVSPCSLDKARGVGHGYAAYVIQHSP